MIDNDRILDEITKVSGKVDKIDNDVTDMKISVAVMEEKMKSREAEKIPDRVKELENWKTKSIAYVSSISFVMSIVMSLGMAYFKKMF